MEDDDDDSLFTPFLSHTHSHSHNPLKKKLSPPLSTLPENGEFSFLIPSPPSSSLLKESLIFGTPIDKIPSPPPPPPPHSIPSPSILPQSYFRTNLHRCRTAPAISVSNTLLNSPPHSSSLPKPNSSLVTQTVILLTIYLALGVGVFSLNATNFNGESTNPIVDAFYFCVVTMCTIGYGDITPSTPVAKIFSVLFVLVGFGFVDVLLSAMVNNVLDIQETLLLKGHNPRNYIVDVKKGRMRIRWKIGIALGVVVLCIGIGMGFLRVFEKLDWLDAFYLAVMSVTTVGYGDRAFKSLHGRVFASVWLLISTLMVARAFLYLAEWRIHKRHRLIAKWALNRNMTVGDLLAADIDNNGSVSKSEFVIYKLKEMGKIGEKDILQILDQFNRLDTGNCGKITLSDLMEGPQ